VAARPRCGALSASGLPRECEAVLESCWPVVRSSRQSWPVKATLSTATSPTRLGAPAFYAHRSHAASMIRAGHLHSDVAGRRITLERRCMRIKYGTEGQSLRNRPQRRSTAVYLAAGWVIPEDRRSGRASGAAAILVEGDSRCCCSVRAGTPGTGR